MKHVISKLGRFCRIDEIIGMGEDNLHYRNKMQAVFSSDVRGNIVSGVWQTAVHRIAKTDSCLIEDEVSSWIVRAARKFIRENRISVYNERTGKGAVRHIMVRRAKATDEIMVVLVTRGERLKLGEELARDLVKRFPSIRTVVHYVNNTDIPLWLEKEQAVLYGEGYIEDVLCGVRFRISPKSFYQINAVQTEILYTKAVEFASLTGNEYVVDAYCGIGTIGMIASSKAKSVIGIECEDSSVKNAIDNKNLNNISNYNVIKGDSGKVMTGLVEKGERIDVVFTDPPRAGCSREFLNCIVRVLPEKIVYVSCNPDTLARDLSFITKNKYKVRKIQPVDMFPHTTHIECVVKLERVK